MLVVGEYINDLFVVTVYDRELNVVATLKSFDSSTIKAGNCVCATREDTPQTGTGYTLEVTLNDAAYSKDVSYYDASFNATDALSPKLAGTMASGTCLFYKYDEAADTVSVVGADGSPVVINGYTITGTTEGLNKGLIVQHGSKDM